MHLENLGDPNPFMTPLQRVEDRQRATQTWAKVCNAMNVLRISSNELQGICSVLAAIYHIGLAGVSKGILNLLRISCYPLTYYAFVVNEIVILMAWW